MSQASALRFLENRPDEHPDGYTPIEIATNWIDDDLESIHNYIQWCFPLTEASNYNASAPILNIREIRQIQSSNEAQESLRLLTWRMIDFYDRTATRWITQHDHNHLRISRIIKSLGLLAPPKYGLLFYHFIMYRLAASSRGLIVNPTSVEIWRNAANEITYPGTKTASDIMRERNAQLAAVDAERHGAQELAHGGEKIDPHPHHSTEYAIYLQALAQERNI